MAKPYSRDLRERMVRAVQAGRSRHEAARLFEVSASCVIKLMQRYEATGDCEPGKFGGHKRPALIGYEDNRARSRLPVAIAIAVALNKALGRALAMRRACAAFNVQ